MSTDMKCKPTIDDKVHLLVFQSFGKMEEARTNCEAFHYDVNHDLRWNNDQTCFRMIRLKWWDDASYIRYQAGDDYPDSDEPIDFDLVFHPEPELNDLESNVAHTEIIDDGLEF